MREVVKINTDRVCIPTVWMRRKMRVMSAHSINEDYDTLIKHDKAKYMVQPNEPIT